MNTQSHPRPIPQTINGCMDIAAILKCNSEGLGQRLRPMNENSRARMANHALFVQALSGQFRLRREQRNSNWPAKYTENVEGDVSPPAPRVQPIIDEDIPTLVRLMTVLEAENQDISELLISQPKLRKL